MQIFDETDIFSIILQYVKYIKRLEKIVLSDDICFKI